ncbi:MAG: ABC transporter permease [Paenibacillus macerans]|uniref:ABC-2 transporter family protein n=2 Tax=Paenibacillus macerans TaxID=44252 RepID=A0A090ZAM2_PAEMA|nr:ABC transporter permease [Paenibacillus macerans]KFN07662.1 ABC-2 transporter family protein [Paenibacillus macerans]MBS5913553.1 ABC transporter permease [Paenibacillus macerans]MCY7559580.1 ABC transporter permease [Paenibacillus macerans]MDU5947084.1 ABC transporter permease [Paenibacillus macerans]MDU7474106.1 ABC transporter permease [Paenibacillus macerans]
MKTFLNVLAAERLKMSRSRLWLVLLASPLLSTLIGLLMNLPDGADAWPALLGGMSMLHAMLFLPIMAGLFASFICRYEHTGGGWKQLLVLPVSRPAVYMAKFTVVISLLAATQLIFLVMLLIVSQVQGLAWPIPWSMIAVSLIGGLVACLPLVALQLGVSLAWSSFAAPLAVNVSLTIPNMLIVNSDKVAPFYPWAQPILAMMPKGEADYGAFNLPIENLLITVLGSFLIFLAAGILYFRRKAV